jgi:hypothetical protein
VALSATDPELASAIVSADGGARVVELMSENYEVIVRGRPTAHIDDFHWVDSTLEQREFARMLSRVSARRVAWIGVRSGEKDETARRFVVKMRAAVDACYDNPR